MKLVVVAAAQQYIPASYCCIAIAVLQAVGRVLG